MTPELETLARRAIACPKWRWMPGMRVIIPARHTITDRVSEEGWLSSDGDYPDFSDPATLGCLLALVREAHCDQQMFVETYAFLRNNWRCTGVSFSMQWDAPTEAAALVAALEAAP